MPSIPVVLELDHRNLNPVTVPGNTTQQVEIPCPVGYQAMSFGWSGQSSTLIIQTATLQPPDVPDGVQRFLATVRNSSAQDQVIRFSFLLVKV